jgi:hypothetical protein
VRRGVHQQPGGGGQWWPVQLHLRLYPTQYSSSGSWLSAVAGGSSGGGREELLLLNSLVTASAAASCPAVALRLRPPRARAWSLTPPSLPQAHAGELDSGGRGRMCGGQPRKLRLRCVLDLYHVRGS